MTETDFVDVGVTIRADQLDALDELVAERNRRDPNRNWSRSAVVREVLDDGLAAAELLDREMPTADRRARGAVIRQALLDQFREGVDG